MSINELKLAVDKNCEEAKSLNMFYCLIGSERKNNVLYNFVGCYVKFFLWRCRCQDINPTTTALKNYLKIVFKTEMYIKKKQLTSISFVPSNLNWKLCVESLDKYLRFIFFIFCFCVLCVFFDSL